MSAVEEVRNLAEAVVSRRSLRLWDVELAGAPGRAIVRVLVDADGGINLDTIAEVSEELSRALDLHDLLQGRYTLEVSSPGLERNLKSPEHFRLSLGKKVMVKTKTPLVGESHRVDGLIREAKDDEVAIEAGGGEVLVPYGAIKTARTVFEW